MNKRGYWGEKRLNSESYKTKSQTYNIPTGALKKSVIIQLIARKISIFNKNTKAWIQNETKNVMESIETNKKLVMEMFYSPVIVF